MFAPPGVDSDSSDEDVSPITSPSPSPTRANFSFKSLFIPPRLGPAPPSPTLEVEPATTITDTPPAGTKTHLQRFKRRVRILAMGDVQPTTNKGESEQPLEISPEVQGTDTQKDPEADGAQDPAAAQMLSLLRQLMAEQAAGSKAPVQVAQAEHEAPSLTQPFTSDQASQRADSDAPTAQQHPTITKSSASSQQVADRPASPTLNSVSNPTSSAPGLNDTYFHPENHPPIPHPTPRWPPQYPAASQPYYPLQADHTDRHYPPPMYPHPPALQPWHAASQPYTYHPYQLQQQLQPYYQHPYPPQSPLALPYMPNPHRYPPPTPQPPWSSPGTQSRPPWSPTSPLANPWDRPQANQSPYDVRSNKAEVGEIEPPKAQDVNEERVEGDVRGVRRSRFEQRDGDRPGSAREDLRPPEATLPAQSRHAVLATGTESLQQDTTPTRGHRHIETDSARPGAQRRSVAAAGKLPPSAITNEGVRPTAKLADQEDKYSRTPQQTGLRSGSHRPAQPRSSKSEPFAGMLTHPLASTSPEAIQGHAASDSEVDWAAALMSLAVCISLGYSAYNRLRAGQNEKGTHGQLATKLILSLGKSLAQGKDIPTAFEAVLGDRQSGEAFAKELRVVAGFVSHSTLFATNEDDSRGEEKSGMIQHLISDEKIQNLLQGWPIGRYVSPGIISVAREVSTKWKDGELSLKIILRAVISVRQELAHRSEKAGLLDQLAVLLSKQLKHQSAPQPNVIKPEPLSTPAKPPAAQSTTPKAPPPQLKRPAKPRSAPGESSDSAYSEDEPESPGTLESDDEANKMLAAADSGPSVLKLRDAGERRHRPGREQVKAAKEVLMG